MKQLMSVLTVCLLVACGQQDAGLALKHAVVTQETEAVEDFRLQDQSGNNFTRADLLGRWTLLFSGFTHCPDICPNTLGVLKAAEQQITGDPHHRVVLLSVDPGRDTPAVLKKYLAWFNPGWIGLTGTDAEVDRLLASLEMARVRVPIGNGSYTMDHSGAVILLDPQARKVAYWKPPVDAARLAADLSVLPAP